MYQYLNVQLVFTVYFKERLSFMSHTIVISHNDGSRHASAYYGTQLKLKKKTSESLSFIDDYEQK